jgi:hypothetical protein
VSDQDAAVERWKRAYAALAEDVSPAASCPAADRIWAAVAGEAPPLEARAVVLHAASCAACAVALRLAREVAVEAVPLAAPGRGPAWRVAAVAASLLLVALTAWLLVDRRPGPGGPFDDLAIARAEYVPHAAEDELVWRGEDPGAASSGPTLFDEAMEAYERDDFARAEALLGRVAEDDPHATEARFYRGVSLLLLGRPADAAAPLAAAEASATGALRDEARYYLALARLKGGDLGEARRLVDALIEDGGARRAEAEALRARIEAVHP